MPAKMKITSITYAMLRKTGMYENDRAEVTIDVEAATEQDIVETIDEAKRVCRVALGLTPPTVEEKLKVARTALENVEAEVRKARRAGDRW